MIRSILKRLFGRKSGFQKKLEDTNTTGICVFIGSLRERGYDVGPEIIIDLAIRRLLDCYLHEPDEFVKVLEYYEIADDYRVDWNVAEEEQDKREKQEM